MVLCNLSVKWPVIFVCSPVLLNAIFCGMITIISLLLSKASCQVVAKYHFTSELAVLKLEDITKYIIGVSSGITTFASFVFAL